MPLPEKWPLTARGLITNEEHEVLTWLRSTFDDHLVMVKLPVLRFLTPVSREKNGDGQRWQRPLSGVYCSFTVCTTNGNVVGCVDVPGKRGLPKGSRDLKESLLSDCSIAYTVVRPAYLPERSAMRAAFLGEMAEDEQQDHEVTRGGDSSFHADLETFTKQAKRAAKEAALKKLNKSSDTSSVPNRRPSGFNHEGTGGFDTHKLNRFPTQFEDSFTHPSDSRPAKLNRAE